MEVITSLLCPLYVSSPLSLLPCPFCGSPLTRLYRVKKWTLSFAYERESRSHLLTGGKGFTPSIFCAKEEWSVETDLRPKLTGQIPKVSKVHDGDSGSYNSRGRRLIFGPCITVMVGNTPQFPYDTEQMVTSGNQSL